MMLLELCLSFPIYPFLSIHPFLNCYIGVFLKGAEIYELRDFSEFRESDKSLKHESDEKYFLSLDSVKTFRKNSKEYILFRQKHHRETLKKFMAYSWLILAEFQRDKILKLLIYSSELIVVCCCYYYFI